MIENTIERILDNLRVNEYSNENIVDIEDGFWKCNCSGAILEVLKANGVVVPAQRAYEVFEYFKKSNYEIIKNIDDLRKGDLIVWRKNVVPEKGSSGHLSIFLEKVEQTESDISIRVFDCVKIIHDDDSRKENGIGTGILKILHKDLNPIGFVWSSVKKKTKLTEMLIVRPESNSLDSRA